MDKMQFRMTDEEYAKLKEVSYFTLYGHYEQAEKQWQAIANRVGCDWTTIRRADTGDDRDFIAMPIITMCA